ncbi:MAG: methionyl-tRNA formyltransferase [Candidatus Firestonebacteria bacterium]
MKILFFGSSKFSIPGLKILNKSENIIGVVCQPDKPAGRGLQLKAPLIKEVALELKLPVFQQDSVNTPEFLSKLKTLVPELIVVVSFGQILSNEVLNYPKNSCINLHPSLLPKYRGPAPIQWAIANGEKTTGVTTIFLIDAVDSGDIMLQRSVDIKFTDTYEILSERLAEEGAILLKETIGLIKNGNVPRIKQDNSLGTYAPLLKRFNSAIDWNKSAIEIYNLIRAFNPWPGTFTKLWSGERRQTINRKLNDVLIKILEAETIEKDIVKKPGEIIEIIKGTGLLIATGENCLLIKKIQPAGKRAMSVDEFLHGHNVKIGGILK